MGNSPCISELLFSHRKDHPKGFYKACSNTPNNLSLLCSASESNLPSLLRPHLFLHILAGKFQAPPLCFRKAPSFLSSSHFIPSFSRHCLLAHKSKNLPCLRKWHQPRT
uniref:Uncharacterized protein n=1 Tax=Opuntia streptacantha TaxID=393608 RepID=A0A7C8Z3T7_OPUST